MGQRRRAREAALQALYEIDLNPDLTPQQALAHVFETFGRAQSEQAEHGRRVELPPADEAELRRFATHLVAGVRAAHAEIDAVLTKASTHWRLERMAAVDRNLLRLAIYELLHEHAIPLSVTIDEAVEIAKRFGTEESSAFINGVLHRIAGETGRKE